jgi:hypothetical protein
MLSKKLGHLLVARELPAIRLRQTLSNSRARLIVEMNRTIAPGHQVQKQFGRLILFFVRQDLDFRQSLFEQFRHL